MFHCLLKIYLQKYFSYVLCNMQVIFTICWILQESSFFLLGFIFTRLFYRVQYPTYHQQAEILSLFHANIKKIPILDISESHYLSITSLKYSMLAQCCIISYLVVQIKIPEWFLSPVCGFFFFFFKKED